MHPSAELAFDLISGQDTANASLHLKNRSDSRVAFKVKTTVPEAYLVRPTLGVIEAQESLEVVITLKTQKLNSSQKHKFSIQSVKTSLDPSDSNGISSLWSTVGKTGVQNALLRVTFSSPEGEKIPTRDSFNSSPGASEPVKMSSIQVKELNDANTQYTELVKYNVSFRQQQLCTERQSLERELKELREVQTIVIEAPKLDGQVTRLQLFLVLVLGLVLGIVFLR